MHKKKFMIAGACLLTFLLLMCSFWIYQKKQQDYVKAQSEVQEYQQKMIAEMAEAKESASNLGMVSAEMQKQITGCDRSRVKKDDNTIDSLLSSALTWDSEESYDAGRDLLMKKTGLTEDSRFMTTFFKNKYVYDTDGNAYNSWPGWAEEGLNMSYEGMQSHLVDIQDNVYSYMTIVMVSTSTKFTPATGEAWENSSDGRCLFLYKTDGNGKIFDMDAYILS